MDNNHSQQPNNDPLRQRAFEREAHIYSCFELFSNKWKDSIKDEVYLNRQLLSEATYRYFVDSDIKKSEHNIDWTDCHKRAAFTAKWLLHFRPIQYKSIHAVQTMNIANEQFALFMICAFLEVDIRDLSDSLIKHIIYHFRHEFYHPEPWACTFYIIECCAKAKVLHQLK